MKNKFIFNTHILLSLLILGCVLVLTPVNISYMPSYPINMFLGAILIIIAICKAITLQRYKKLIQINESQLLGKWVYSGAQLEAVYKNILCKKKDYIDSIFLLLILCVIVGMGFPEHKNIILISSLLVFIYQLIVIMNFFDNLLKSPIEVLFTDKYICFAGEIYDNFNYIYALNNSTLCITGDLPSLNLIYGSVFDTSEEICVTLPIIPGRTAEAIGLFNYYNKLYSPLYS
ncbi:MAG: hypothetical protein BEN19_00255 [Epulopiscium sp. Nuni2H_MBin003]|nr:MAG: hypothetical protein BEN19_00255 [Epulopiscium sp. Nuni2H_MBin003]